MNPSFNAPLVLLMQNFFIISFFTFLGICIYLYRAKSKYLLAFLPLLALSTHQFEEYVLSPLLFGDYYHFLNWAYRNAMDISPMEVTLLNLAPYIILLPALIISRARSEKYLEYFFFSIMLLPWQTQAFILVFQQRKIFLVREWQAPCSFTSHSLFMQFYLIKKMDFPINQLLQSASMDS